MIMLCIMYMLYAICYIVVVDHNSATTIEDLVSKNLLSNASATSNSSNSNSKQ